MKPIRFNAFAPINVRSLERAFDEFFSPNLSQSLQNQKPLVNVVENADNFKLEVAAPGLTREDFKVSVEKDQLIISASKENQEVEDKENYSRREFNYTSFKRSFYLPETVDADAIGANYDNGVLVLTLPKKEEAKEKGPRLVEVI